MAAPTASVPRIAPLAARTGSVALGLLVVGAGSAYTGLLRPELGFRVFLLGLLVSLLALLLGGVALLLTGSPPSRPGRGQALLGTGLGGLGVAVLVVAALPGASVPPINDITTDLDDPPRFVAALDDPSNPDRTDMSHPGAEMAAQQRAGYPDLAPTDLPVPPAEALERAAEAARALGWEGVARDPAGLRLEARDTSTIFRFVDDVVVRVRPHPQGSGVQGSRVDVRSRSRAGRGDLGANAARIRAFQDALTE